MSLPLLQWKENTKLFLDGDFCYPLYDRLAAKPGSWEIDTTEFGRDTLNMLHREYCRAGAQVVTAYTVACCEELKESSLSTCDERIKVAMSVASKVASEANLPLGVRLRPFHPSSVYSTSEMEEKFTNALESFREHSEFSYVIIENFDSVEECLCAVRAAKPMNLFIIATMSIGHEGDVQGFSVEDCMDQLYRSEVNMVGVSDFVDPFLMMTILARISEWRKSAELNNIGICGRPLGFMTPDIAVGGIPRMPEYPLALQPRKITIWDALKYAKHARSLRVDAFGGGLGFDSLLLSSFLAEYEGTTTSETTNEIGSVRNVSALCEDRYKFVQARASIAYWDMIPPASGRPMSPACSQPVIQIDDEVADE